MKISIIVPVYNVEQYLERCITSCENINIPRDEFEIIIINDGSTDSSLEVANKLASEYSNIYVYTQENQGQSVARNFGIGKALGDYIWFVDGDDYIASFGVNETLNAAYEKNCDILFFPIVVFSPNGESSIYGHDSFIGNSYSGEELVLSGFEHGSLCKCFILRNLILKHSLKFTRNITSEDAELSIKVCSLASKIYFHNIPLYNYFYNPNSSSRNPDFKTLRHRTISDITVAKNIHDFALSNIKSAKLQQYIISHSNSILVGNLMRCLKHHTKESKKLSKETFDLMEEQRLYPIKGKTLSLKSTILAKLFNLPLVKYHLTH